jgi:hypothetical protein
MPRSSHSVRPEVEGLERRLVPAVTFAARQTFAAGDFPVGVAVADFNGDGLPDLAVPNRGGSSVSVFLDTTTAGASTLSFASSVTFAVGQAPSAVAVGDINGDGRPDLVVVNSLSNTLSVLLNTTPTGAGVPSFATQQTFSVGMNPQAVAVGDFNGDGRSDLAVANFGNNSVLVLMDTTPAGTGTVSFFARPFVVGGSPTALAVADLNGDGRPDLAVANSADKSLSVLVNTTPAGAFSPSFSAQQSFAVGTNPFAVAAGDFNGDGRPDLAVANYLDNDVSILLNTTAAGATNLSFAAQHTFATGTTPNALAVTDFDGDGRPDLAAVNNADGTASVLLNTMSAGAATPSFTAQQVFAAGPTPDDLAVGDFNADGRPDLVVSDFVGNDVSVLRDTTAPFASTVPGVVGQFGGQGVWEYNRAVNTWVQLTPANASRLAADPIGDVVGAFPGAGVWLYRPASGWHQINGVDASLLVIDAQGDVAAEFPDYGVGEYLPAAGWRSLTAANATLLAMDALGDVAGEFPGYGVQLFRPAFGWKQINGVDASLLAMDSAGDVVAEFRGVGVGEYLPASGWRLLNGVDATALAVSAGGGVTAEFPGVGVGAYLPASGWRPLTAAAASLLGADALGSVYGEFAGYGVWEYDVYRGWHQITAADAALLAVA